MVGGDLAQTVVSGVSGPGDPVTRSVVPMRATAVDARCDAPAVDADPVTPPASLRPPPSASVRVTGDDEVDVSAEVGECSSPSVESTRDQRNGCFSGR